MDRENIERFVDIQNELELGGKVADNSTNNAKDNSSPGCDVTGAGSDGYKSGNRTGAETDDRPLALETVVEKHPGESAHRSGKVSGNERHDSPNVGAQRRTTVEAKPADPEEDGTENDHGHVVGPVRQAS